MKRQVITIGLVVLLALSVQVSLMVNSFPGYGGSADCSRCHNEPGNAYNSAYMDNDITLDGNHSEAFWGETFSRRMMIPVATTFGGSHIFVTTIFAQNSTHMFMLLRWDDLTINGTDDDAYTDADGVAIMFNINVTDFTSDNFGGPMSTKNAGEAVDVYVWKPAASETNAHDLTQDPKSNLAVTANTYDYAINFDGWSRTEDSNVEMAGRHGNVTNGRFQGYQVELVRPLVTGDINDAQFEFSGYYDFTIAIFNSSSGSSHMIGFPHQVYVHNADPLLTTVTVEQTNTNTVDFTITNTEDAANFTAIFTIGLVTLAFSALIIQRSKVKKFDL